MRDEHTRKETRLLTNDGWENSVSRPKTSTTGNRSASSGSRASATASSSRRPRLSPIAIRISPKNPPPATPSRSTDAQSRYATELPWDDVPTICPGVIEMNQMIESRREDAKNKREEKKGVFNLRGARLFPQSWSLSRADAPSFSSSSSARSSPFKTSRDEKSNLTSKKGGKARVGLGGRTQGGRARMAPIDAKNLHISISGASGSLRSSMRVRNNNP